jgi:hypothetical protein
VSGPDRQVHRGALFFAVLFTAVGLYFALTDPSGLGRFGLPNAVWGGALAAIGVGCAVFARR